MTVTGEAAAEGAIELCATVPEGAMGLRVAVTEFVEIGEGDAPHDEGVTTATIKAASINPFTTYACSESRNRVSSRSGAS